VRLRTFIACLLPLPRTVRPAASIIGPADSSASSA
jgi:hypothetical protein